MEQYLSFYLTREGNPICSACMRDIDCGATPVGTYQQNEICTVLCTVCGDQIADDNKE